MHYFVTYDKKTGAVTGYLKSTVSIHPAPRNASQAMVRVTDEKDIAALSGFRPGSDVLRGQVQSGVLHKLKAEPAYQGRVVLSCDREDLDGDGLPELPADGKSVVAISAQLMSEDGKPVEAEGIRLNFGVTSGALSARYGTVSDGAAQVSLRTGEETIEVQVKASAPGFLEGVLRLQVIPVDEYRGLAEGNPA